MNESKVNNADQINNQRYKLAEDQQPVQSWEKGAEKEIISLPKYTMAKSKKKVLSPTIFIDKSNSWKPEGDVSPGVLLFEQLLTLVCKSYYKYSFQAEPWLRELETTAKPQLMIRERSMATLKIQKVKNKSNQGSLGTKMVIKTTSRMGQDRRGSERSRVRGEADNSHIINRSNMLDYLTSPLKVDQIWGVLIRAMGPQGNRHF